MAFNNSVGLFIVYFIVYNERGKVDCNVVLWRGKMGFWQIFHNGGWVMYPLLLFSIASWCVIIEKLVTFWKFGQLSSDIFTQVIGPSRKGGVPEGQRGLSSLGESIGERSTPGLFTGGGGADIREFLRPGREESPRHPIGPAPLPVGAGDGGLIGPLSLGFLAPWWELSAPLRILPLRAREGFPWWPQVFPRP